MAKSIGVIGGADGPTAIFLAGKIGFDVMYILLVLNLIIPFVMILVGVILRKCPVSDMGSHNGYNTPAARKSQAHWDYAQSIAPDIFIKMGKILLVVEILLSIILFVVDIGASMAIIIGMVVGLSYLFYAFMKTEKAIKDKFSDK